MEGETGEGEEGERERRGGKAEEEEDKDEFRMVDYLTSSTKFYLTCLCN